MSQAPASVRSRVSTAPESWRPTTALSALSELRRAKNRKNHGLVAELRCECATPTCRETFPATAVRHRGTPDRFIVAPGHLNGDRAVKVADRFFVIELRTLVAVPNET